MASRPKVVANHGIPAYGYGPVGRRVVSRATSARDLPSHVLNCSPELCSEAPVRRIPRIERRAAAAAARNRDRPGVISELGPTSKNSAVWAPSSSERFHSARAALRRLGLGQKATTDERGALS